LNSDQGVQFTCPEFTGRVEAEKIRISMDGRGRCMDNIFTERLWRSVKYEDVYLKDYDGVPVARTGLGSYFEFYNHRRRHQSLDYLTPAKVYGGARWN
jgi:putative transposase